MDSSGSASLFFSGLKGLPYAYKELRKRWDNPHAFPKRRLYLNLVAPAKNDKGDMVYDFIFLTDEEAKESQNDTFWFRIGDILDIKNQSGVNKFLLQNKLMNRPEGQAEFANETLFKLWSVVHDAKVINYFLEKDESLDKVLNTYSSGSTAGERFSATQTCCYPSPRRNGRSWMRARKSPLCGRTECHRERFQF